MVLMGLFRSSSQDLISASDRADGQHTFVTFVVLKV